MFTSRPALRSASDPGELPPEENHTSSVNADADIPQRGTS